MFEHVPDAPWPVQIAIFLILVWVVNRPTARKVRKINEQVTNDHDTNLRHDLDALAAHVRASVSKLRRKLVEQREEQEARLTRRIEVLSDYVRDVDGSVKGLGQSLERRTGLLEEQLEFAVRERDQKISQTAESAKLEVKHHIEGVVQDRVDEVLGKDDVV